MIYLFVSTSVNKFSAFHGYFMQVSAYIALLSSLSLLSSSIIASPMLKLFYHPISPPARAVLIFLKHTKIPHEIVPVDFINAEHTQQHYLKVNSMGQLPAINDDGFALAECQAIMTYLHGSRKCSDDLYPADLKKRALVDRHLHWYHTNIRLGGSLFRKTGVDPVRKARVAIGSPEDTRFVLVRSLTQMEKWLNAGTYMVGNNITLADFATHAYCNQLNTIKYDFGVYPRVKEWMARLNSLPEVEEVTEPFYAFYDQLLRSTK